MTGILVAESNFSSGGESCFAGEEKTREALGVQMLRYLPQPPSMTRPSDALMQREAVYLALRLAVALRL